MAKKRIEKPKREVSKHHLSRLQQQAKRQRRILIAGIAVIAAVGGIMGGGWYMKEYQPLQQTVIRVNDAEFDMRYYIDMLELDYRYNVAGNVVMFIEQNELIRQGVEAADMGITASDSEISEELESHDPPLGKEYQDVARVSVLTGKLLTEHFEQEIPLSTEQRHVLVMFLESESQVAEVRDRLEEGEDFSELAGELSLEGLTKAENGDLGWHPQGILSEVMGTSVPEDYALASKAGVLSEPLYDEAITKNIGYWVVEVLEIDEEGQVRVQVMLLGSEQGGQEAIARLEDGEDFGELVEELSQDIASRSESGDLGWLTPEKVAAILDDFIFNSEPGEISEPIRDDGVRTTGGYWLVKVDGKDDDRQIEDVDRNWMKLKALDGWIASLWDDPENQIEDYLDSERMLWAMNKARANIAR